MDKLTNFLTANKIPIGHWGKKFITFITINCESFFDSVSYILTFILENLVSIFLWFSPPFLVMVIALLAWYLQKSWRLAFFVVFGLLFIINQGLWKEAIETIVLVVSATTVSMTIGVPIGILAAHNRRIYVLLHPLLDLMQTMPTFVYLIPVLLLFGLGIAPGFIVTVIFATPAPIRLTYLGIISVPKILVDAGEAFGATKQQLLWKIELPAALPAIMAGLTQCIMLSLSMVVIAALIGASGLGNPVVRSLNSLNISLGIEAGIAIVILAIVIDRMCRVSIGEKV
ncbi:choline ABC transporter permease subunit [Legionella brunensis]|uniref:Quaternary amine ABV transporter (QAT), permease/periplasmic amine-binding protein n=1 Tax=Legionella brunensis TaxID=29422 RepID=A0A0W0SPH0_9GAMM|nr:choline ABC transporter permease subunit [Legionella brunensis]KTC85164.1 quaternary amine ABV transporter (QAT), permease/periplasmic amine-binding protein [Legionella brunensis]